MLTSFLILTFRKVANGITDVKSQADLLGECPSNGSYPQTYPCEAFLLSCHFSSVQLVNNKYQGLVNGTISLFSIFP